MYKDNLMNGQEMQKFVVVLKFNLKPGYADEELRRSQQANSFPNMLARQPGCERIELVKVSDDTTMSVQTWSSQSAWWAALDAVKQQRAAGETESVPPEEILLSRDYFGGNLVLQVRG